jgi:ABC-type sugar transport system ATPase subunit
VFCLDEPLSALDPVLRTAARRDLDALLRDEGRCAMHVTHDQAEAMTLGDRVVVLRDGQVQQVGTPRELYDRPATTFVASFLGTHPMSLLPPGLVGVRAPSAVATVGVRAEHVTVEPGGSFHVASVDDLGHERIATLEVEAFLLRAQLPLSSPVTRGDRVAFAVREWTGFDAAGVRVA